MRVGATGVGTRYGTSRRRKRRRVEPVLNVLKNFFSRLIRNFHDLFLVDGETKKFVFAFEFVGLRRRRKGLLSEIFGFGNGFLTEQREVGSRAGFDGGIRSNVCCTLTLSNGFLSGFGLLLLKSLMVSSLTRRTDAAEGPAEKADPAFESGVMEVAPAGVDAGDPTARMRLRPAASRSFAAR